jgi:alkylated DNA repair protein alkB family protein 8
LHISSFFFLPSSFFLQVYWHKVKDFLEALPTGTLLADVGSGDGKYFGVNPNIVTVGCDRSWKLLEVSRDIEHQTFCCDAVQLPLQDNSFDATMCIAVLHHLSNVGRRRAALAELLRITKVGGQIMIQVSK